VRRCYKHGTPDGVQRSLPRILTKEVAFCQLDSVMDTHIDSLKKDI